MNVSKTAVNLLVVFVCNTISLTALAQEKKEVEIINADFLKFQEINGQKLTRLVGNVQLRQEEVFMWCDSAVLDKETNSVDAWGNIAIQQDTTTAYSNVLHYDGNRKFATLNGNASIISGKMKLYTNELFYDVHNKTSYYLAKGKVIKDSTVITSQKGYFYSAINDVFFRDNVVIKDPNYDLISDTLRYNTNSNVSTFYGNTEIFNKDSRITCQTGWYDSNRDLCSFGKNTVVNNPSQILKTDSLYYDRGKGIGIAYRFFQWIDSTNETELIGNYGEYEESRQNMMATKNPLLIYKMKEDSLFVSADTLKSQTVSRTDTTRVFFAYHKVKMFMKDMQGTCDSLYYSFLDSTFRMYYSPVLWSAETQMSADTILLTTKNGQAEKMNLYNAGFIIAPSGKKYYDQIKGINIVGYFKDNTLTRMDVMGNAESIYFGKDEKEKFIGNNKALSAAITMYFKDKKIDKIVFIEKPEAVFTPMKMLTEEQMRLTDFVWRIDQKPKKREDVWLPKP
jgi:lipopolysaccharide assembly outer membrane protein LptD (OstA)